MTGDSSPKSTTAFRILVLGGSYGGLAAVIDLLDICGGNPARSGNKVPVKYKVPINITLVDQRDGFFHLIGAPLALIDEHAASNFWTKFDHIPALRRQDLQIVQGSVQSVDHERMTASILPHGEDSDTYTLEYDYLVAATGFKRVWPTVPQELDRESYLDEVRGHIKLVRGACHGVAVIGGGAVGIEMCAEIKSQYPDAAVTLVHSRDHLLSAEPLPTDFGIATLEVLRHMGVDVILGSRVIEVIPGSNERADTSKLVFSDGTTMHASHVISAISRPLSTATFFPQEVLNQNREVVVRSSLQFSDHLINSDCHFAVGDIAAWPPDSAPVIKRCGMAMYQGNIAAVNIYQHILCRLGHVQDLQYRTLPIYEPVMALALGETAIGYSPQSGINSGKELCEAMFGNDLGLTICWKHMDLVKAVRKDATLTALGDSVLDV